MSEINIRGRATVRNDTGRLPDEGDIPVGEVALPPLEEEKRSFVRHRRRRAGHFLRQIGGTARLSEPSCFRHCVIPRKVSLLTLRQVLKLLLCNNFESVIRAESTR